LTSGQGSGFRVDGAPYIRLEGRNLRVLTSVVGRSEKGRRPERPSTASIPALRPCLRAAFP